MPPGAKKRKALKKKQQQSIGTSRNNNGFNFDNLHGNDEHGRSQDDRESDSSLSSPGSQEFGVTKHPSSSSALDTTEKISDVTHQGLGPISGNAIIGVEQGTDDKKNNTSPISSNGISTQDPSANEISPVVDYVSQVVFFENSEHAETSTHSKAGTLPGPADGTGRKVESVRESEAPVSSEEKSLLLPGPQALRTSWLSCCGLFDAMTGSDRN
ncbi:hypothetical protein N665_0518s0012 [Sinapis alba]|nr:hypothetical protein N665_0518s0012 [Sinapis alba]